MPKILETVDGIQFELGDTYMTQLNTDDYRFGLLNRATKAQIVDALSNRRIDVEYRDTEARDKNDDGFDWTPEYYFHEGPNHLGCMEFSDEVLTQIKEWANEASK